MNFLPLLIKTSTRLHFLMIGLLTFCANTANADQRNVQNSPTNEYKVSTITPASTQVALTQAERQWLKEVSPIKFSGDPNWLPYEAFDQQGNYQGIVAEYMKLIEERLAITLEVVPVDTWPSAIEKVRKGDIHFVSSSKQSIQDIKKTTPYLRSPVVIVMRKTQGYVDSLRQITDLKIGSSAYFSSLKKIEQDYSQLSFTKFPNTELGLVGVSTGEIDAMLVNLPQANFYIAKLGMSNLRIVGKTKYLTELTFSVTPELEPLIPILNKAIAAIPLPQLQQILDSWGSSKFAPHTDYKLTFKIAAILLAIVIVIAFWVIRLRHEVAKRRAAQNQLSILLDNIPQQVAVINTQGKLLMANPQAQSDFAINANQLEHFDLLSIFVEVREGAKLLRKLNTQGKVERCMLSIKSTKCAASEVMCSVLPITYHNRPAYLCIGIDLTEQAAMERHLIQAKAQAEIASQAKSEFLANMSHEIRTPMNAILGFANLVHEKISEPKLKSQTAIIKSAGSSLLHIINDILDVSKIEANKMNVQKTLTDLRLLIDEISVLYSPQAVEKGLILNVIINEKLPALVEIDSQRVRQILSNLLGNAIKFTERGCIDIKVEATKGSTEQLNLLLSISDTGIGIPSDQQEYIFESFNQQLGQSNQYGGSGLGLTISRKLARLMDGDILLESKPGKGATFSLNLSNVSYAHAPTQPLKRRESSSAKISFLPARVLIVDDIENNRLLLQETLSQLNIDHIDACDGLEAVKLSKKHHFDLVIMDIRMPKMNGYQATRVIQENDNPPPIIALTASVVADSEDAKHRHLFAGYLQKPLDKQIFINELRRHLEYSDDMTETDNNLNINNIQICEGANSAALVQQFADSFTIFAYNNDLVQTAELCRQLVRFARQHNDQKLLEFCQKLQLALDTFDISAIKAFVDQLVNLCEADLCH